MVEKSDQASDHSELTPEFKELREIINNYLSSLKLPFVAPNPAPASDHPLYKDCIQYMSSRNWSPTTIKMLQKSLPAGQALDLAYAHLPSISTRVFLILFISFLQLIDDVRSAQYIEALESFSTITLLGGSHGHEYLDAFSDHIREIPRHFHAITGELIFTCTLRHISAVVVEDGLQRASKSSPCPSKKFPLYIRGLTALPEAFALFAFPPSVPWDTYIHIFPEMITYNNHSNDILSFYKEELANEKANLVSLLASSRNTSKLNVIRQMVEDSIKADKVVIKGLQENSEALDAYTHFRAGFVASQTSLSRYRLDELMFL